MSDLLGHRAAGAADRRPRSTAPAGLDRRSSCCSCWTTAASTKSLYPTQADLDAAALAARDNPAALAFNGPDQALDTIGGQVAFQVGAFGLVMVGLMSVLLVGRLTRGEEDSGRLELVRSMPVGRHAPLAAGLARGRRRRTSSSGCS